jgi:hypothetical protein
MKFVHWPKNDTIEKRQAQEFVRQRNAERSAKEILKVLAGPGRPK